MKPINWVHHLIELIVVFIGLTLALLLDSWYDSYKDSKLESQYLAGFLDDIKQDQIELDSILISNNKRKRSLENLQSHLFSKTSSVDSILFYMSSIGSMSPFYPQKSTYESISNSGHLNLISNYQLKRQLVKLYLDYQQAVLIDDIYHQHLIDYIAPFMIKHFDVNTNRIDIKIFYQKEFINMIGIMTNFINQNISFYTKLNATADNVIVLLNEANLDD